MTDNASEFGWFERPEWEQQAIRENPQWAHPDLTAAEWPTFSDCPRRMFNPFHRALQLRVREGRRVSESRADRTPTCREWRGRKACLLTVATCRRVFHLLPGPRGAHCRDVVDALERYADGEVPPSDVGRADHLMLDAMWSEGDMWDSWVVPWAFAENAATELQPEPSAALVWSVLFAMEAVVFTDEFELEDRAGRAFLRVGMAAAIESTDEPFVRSEGWSAQSRAFAQDYARSCDPVRDVFGNPFRPVTFDPTWRTDTAVSLARVMYEAREFSAMPILADALQDAGCDNEAILNHCRDANATHARECWVVDLVLGKV